MRTLIDDVSGAVCFIPESEADMLLLYHLMNCTNMNQFPEYLALEQKVDNRPVSSELGVPVSLLNSYPLETLWDKFGPGRVYENNENGKIKDTIRPINCPPEEETDYYTLKLTNKRKIGFRLDSIEPEGYKYKS